MRRSKSPRFRSHLLRKIKLGDAKTAVFGLGAVGLQVALAFAQASFTCIGIDVDSRKIDEIKLGRAAGHDKETNRLLRSCLRKKKFFATSTFSTENLDYIILCLPTPLNKEGKPDLSYLVDTCTMLSSNDLAEKCIILESSVYPGVTRNVVKPILERRGESAGVDFGLAHSPERIDPGNLRFTMQNIPKLVGGINVASTEVTAALYRATLKAPVVKVSSPEIAEASKMLENTYRFVNICFINEIASLFETIGIDTFEVIRAAATKPFGFLPHFPGPGVGGHCIPKDPFYLAEVAEKVDMRLTIVEAAAKVDQVQPDRIVLRIEQALKSFERTIRGAQITVLGLAYKPNVSDMRRSPALRIIEVLEQKGATVKAYDPLVLQAGTRTASIEQADSLNEAIKGSDVVLLLTDHDVFRKLDLGRIRSLLASRAVLFDSRNVWDKSDAIRNGYLYLGIGKP